MGTDGLLYVIAFLCFLADAARIESRINLTSLGLALLTLSLLV